MLILFVFMFGTLFTLPNYRGHCHRCGHSWCHRNTVGAGARATMSFRDGCSGNTKHYSQPMSLFWLEWLCFKHSYQYPDLSNAWRQLMTTCLKEKALNEPLKTKSQQSTLILHLCDHATQQYPHLHCYYAVVPDQYQYLGLINPMHINIAHTF